MTEQEDTKAEDELFVKQMEEECLKLLTLDNLKRAIPKQKEQIEKIRRVIALRHQKDSKLSNADKFALGVRGISIEDDVMIGLGLKTMNDSEEMRLTQKGFIASQAIHNKLYKDPGKAKAKKNAKLKRRKKNKLKKKARK